MSKRIQLNQVEPNAYKAMLGLENYLQNSDLDKMHKELIKLRASQINGCAYCINLHTRDALKMGETAQRIFLLNAWEESELFSTEEQIILKMTEEITHISQKGLTEETYQNALSTFGENYVMQLIMAIVTINAWNRIAVATHKPLD